MKLAFRTKKVEKLFEGSDTEKLFAELQSFFWNLHLAQSMLVRVNQLKSADSLLDIKQITNANLHPLKWSRRYELAIDVDASGKRGKRRIVFEQRNGENVCDDFYNEQKHKTVTEICILEVNDYH
jgi:hypothetical protein